jgi:hypothetical protein
MFELYQGSTDPIDAWGWNDRFEFQRSMQDLRDWGTSTAADKVDVWVL